MPKDESARWEGMKVSDYLLAYTTEGQKRCQSIAPVHDNQCTKRKKHNKTETNPVHMSGSLVWSSGGQHRHATPGTKLHETIEKVLGPQNLTDWQKDVLDTAMNAKGGTKLGYSSPFKPGFIVDETYIFRTDNSKSMFTPDKMRRWFDRPFSASASDHNHPGGIYHEASKVAEQMSAAQQARNNTRRKQPLDEWWRTTSEREISDTVPKALEYGATDLIDIGSQLGRWMKRDLTDAEAAELGCIFYLVGKMARLTAAVDREEFASDDTIKDIGIYIKMIQRIRSAGSWPGQDLNTDGAFTDKAMPGYDEGVEI